MKTIGFLALVLAACGGGGGTTFKDAPPNVPAMITISGQANERSATATTPVSGAAVAAYSNTDPNTAVAMTTTDASGNYTMMVPTMGKPVDGFVKATKSGYMDTYLVAPAPLTADFASASINMLTPNTFMLISGTLCRANQDAAKGTIAVEVMDANNMTIAGATAAASPAATNTCYDSGGNPNLPSSSATSTAMDGVAIMFNVTGNTTVSATKSGATFKSHSVNAVAGAFTTTLITE